MTAHNPPASNLPSPLPSPESSSIANLTASLRADYNALQNDLEQAQEMAADFQRQLAGKSNEVAHFKVLLEKTQEDLARMEGHITELRQERHRLANEAMIVMDLKHTVEQLRNERSQVRQEAEELRDLLGTASAEYQQQIKLQEIEITRLRTALDAACNEQPSTNPACDPVAAGVRNRISELSATVERLESMMRQHPGKNGQPAKDGSDNFIDISFEP